MNYRENWLTNQLGDFNKQRPEPPRLAICFNLWASPNHEDFDARIRYYSRNIANAAKRLAYFSDITKIGEIMLFMDDRIDTETVQELLGDAPVSIMSKHIEVPESVVDYHNIYSVRFSNYRDERLNNYDYIIQIDDDIWLRSYLSFETVLNALPADINLFCYQHSPDGDYRSSLYYHHSPEINQKLTEFMQENFGRLYASEEVEAIFPAAGFQILRYPYPEFDAFVSDHDFILNDEVLLDIWKYALMKPLGRFQDYEILPESWAPFYHEEEEGFVNVGVPMSIVPDGTLAKLNETFK